MALKVAIVGRPNAGKSTLLNALLGEERMITGPEPGLTRDAVASEWVDETGGKVRLVDTAGLSPRPYLLLLAALAALAAPLVPLAAGSALRGD